MEGISDYWFCVSEEHDWPLNDLESNNHHRLQKSKLLFQQNNNGSMEKVATDEDSSLLCLAYSFFYFFFLKKKKILIPAVLVDSLKLTFWLKKKWGRRKTCPLPFVKRSFFYMYQKRVNSLEELIELKKELNGIPEKIKKKKK